MAYGDPVVYRDVRSMADRESLDNLEYQAILAHLVFQESVVSWACLACLVLLVLQGIPEKKVKKETEVQKV